VEKNEMGEACSAFGGGGAYRVLVGKLSERDHFGVPGVDGRIILRWIFRKWDVWGVDSIELAQDRDRWRALVNAVMNLLSSIKCGEFLDWQTTG
jgi:hypothetical protein